MVNTTEPPRGAGTSPESFQQDVLRTGLDGGKTKVSERPLNELRAVRWVCPVQHAIQQEFFGVRQPRPAQAAIRQHKSMDDSALLAVTVDVCDPLAHGPFRKAAADNRPR